MLRKILKFFRSPLNQMIFLIFSYLSAYGKPPHQALGELFTNFGCLGASSGHLRGVSGRLGSVMGCLGGVLGASWEPLGTSWELLGGVLRRLGRQNRLGALLERFWSRPGSVLEASWGRLGASWKRLGGVLWASWGFLGPSCGPFGTTGSVLEPSCAGFHLGYNPLIDF